MAVSIHIGSVDTSVRAGSVDVSIRLDGPVDVPWRGAFSRAMAGRLDGIAGRWHLQTDTVVIPAVAAGRAGDLAVAVRSAVADANLAVAELADRAEGVRVNADARRGELEREAEDVRRAIVAQLESTEGVTP